MPLLTPPDFNASPLDWAQWYAAQGWPVLPTHTPQPHGCSCNDGPHCAKTGKHPRVSWNQASTNQSTIKDWWTQWPDANIQLMTGSAFCVLDIDNRHHGKESLLALEKQYGILPQTPQVVSGSGSAHYYFQLPTDGCATVDGIAEGIDMKCYRGLIVAPPSLHANGHRYEWDMLFSLDAFDLAPVPQWVIDLSHVKRNGASHGTSALEPGSIIPEGSRYDYLIALAARLRFSGFNEAQIFDALCIANQNCQPPEEEKALREYAKWAGRKETAPAHVLTPALLEVNSTSTTPMPIYMNGVLPPEPQQWGTSFNFDAGVDLDSLHKMMFVPSRFLVDKLVPDGLTILAAPAKSFKSYFSLSLALATIGAGDWCDTFPVEETGNVVFFGLEAPLQQLRNRIYQLRPTYRPEDCQYKITFFSGMQALPPFRHGLQDAIEQVIDHYQPRLIVIDPLSYLYRLGKQDDLASATLDLLWPLAEMASKAQVALFAPEHMRKRSKEDVSVVDQLAGSHIKAAIVHGLLLMHREDQDIVVETTMRDAVTQELVLTMEFDATQHRVMWGYKGANTTLGQSRLDSMYIRATEALMNAGYPMKVQDVIDHCNFPNTSATKNNLRQIFYRAEKGGNVAQSKRGEYYWIGLK